MSIKQYFTSFTFHVSIVFVIASLTGCIGRSNNDKVITDSIAADTIITTPNKAAIVNAESSKNSNPQSPVQAQSTVMHLNDQTFENTIATGVVLVDFWATWCGPCRIQGPIVEDVNNAMGGRVKICKLDIDKSPIISQKYRIQNIPTLIIFKGGRIVKRFVGITQKVELIQVLEAQLK